MTDTETLNHNQTINDPAYRDFYAEENHENQNKNESKTDSDQIIYQPKDKNRDKTVVMILGVLVVGLLIVLAVFVKRMITNRQVELEVTNQNNENLIGEVTEAELFTPATIISPEIENIASPASVVNASASATATPSSVIKNTSTTDSNSKSTSKTQASTQTATSQQKTVATPIATTQAVNANVSTNSYLSGVVYFSGSMPNNASLLVLQRIAGSGSEYKEITRISASNGASWSWNGAQAGQTYEIVYALQVNGNNVRTSQVATAVAPSRVEIKMYTGQN